MKMEPHQKRFLEAFTDKFGAMLMTISGYIDDGYTLDGFLKESPGIYPAIRFRYRPATPHERAQTFDGWERLPESERLGRIATRLAKNILSWDLTDAKGVPVPCNEPGRYRKICGPLYSRLQDVIFQISPPDADPDKEHEETNHAESSPEGNSSAAS